MGGEKIQGSSGAEIAALLPSEASCSAAQSGAGEREVAAAELQRRHDYDALSVIAAHLRNHPAGPFSGRQCEEYVLDARDRLYGASAQPEILLADGWRQWPGGAQPVADGGSVDVRLSSPLRGETEHLGVDPGTWGWGRLDCEPWITAWRPHEPPPLSARPGEGGPALTGDEHNTGGSDE